MLPRKPTPVLVSTPVRRSSHSTSQAKAAKAPTHPRSEDIKKIPVTAPVTDPSFERFLERHGLRAEQKISFAKGIYLIVGEKNRKLSRARPKFEDLLETMRQDQMPDDGIPPIERCASFSIWKNISEMEIDGFSVKDVFHLHKVAIRKNIFIRTKNNH